MLTILELGGAEPARLDGLRPVLEAAGAEPEQATTWVIVSPSAVGWTQARGRQLVIEHVEAPRWSLHTPERALVRTGRLLELTQLYKPAAIVCHSPLLLPIVARVVGMVLEPRPAVICTWVDERARAWAARGLGRIDARLARRGARAWSWWTEQGLASFDAVFVSTREAASSLHGRGLERLYYVPRGADLARFHPNHGGHGGGESEARPRVFIDAPGGVEVRWLRTLWSRLQGGSSGRVSAVLHGPDETDALGRFVARRQGLARCPAGDPDARALALADADVALILPGFDEGRSAVAEAMASGCAVVSAGAGAQLVAGGRCGAVLDLDALSPAAAAQAVLTWLGSDDLDAAKRRARLHAEAEAEQGLCLARELTCVRDVVERMRAGAGVPRGLRELDPPTPTGATPLGPGPANG